jgi:outer membrane lipoprotein-sorting protein
MIILFRIFLILIFLTNISKANITDDIINNLKTTENIQFKFKQTSGTIIDTGNCHLQFPGKLRCQYDGNEGKEIIVTNENLYVVKHKFKRKYRYPINSSPFSIILDKNKILKNLDKINSTSSNDLFHIFEIRTQDGIFVKIFFDKQNKILKGWETISFNQEKVNFLIINPKINVATQEKFEVPNYNNF